MGPLPRRHQRRVDDRGFQLPVPPCKGPDQSLRGEGVAAARRQKGHAGRGLAGVGACWFIKGKGVESTMLHIHKRERGRESLLYDDLRVMSSELGRDACNRASMSSVRDTCT